VAIRCPKCLVTYDAKPIGLTICQDCKYNYDQFLHQINMFDFVLKAMKQCKG
jgi:hypothetical protein